MDYYAMEEGVGALLGLWMSMLGSSVISLGLGIASYVLTALSLYTIAQRRGINHAWMAWVPVLDVWILGSIADQYRYVARGQVKNRRKALIVLSVILVVAVMVIIGIVIGMVVNVVTSISMWEMMPEQKTVELLLGSILPLLGVYLVMLGVGIAVSVIEYIALYDLYTSCDPENKVLFLVLSILLNVAMPFILFFACRNKDRGMPPRKAVPPVENGA